MQETRAFALKRPRDVIDTCSDFIESRAVDRRICTETMRPSWDIAIAVPLECVDVAP